MSAFHLLKLRATQLKQNKIKQHFTLTDGSTFHLFKANLVLPRESGGSRVTGEIQHGREYKQRLVCASRQKAARKGENHPARETTTDGQDGTTARHYFTNI